MTFRLSHAALEDLQSIDDYTVRTWDAEQADRYLAMLWATFERIAKQPTRWRIRADLHPDCRVCFSGRHAILYRLRDGCIEIARVLHDTMDFPAHASDLFPDDG
jgi:toxin ParE1/3/4